ncbi:MAG: hypothetical protein DRJ03_12060 [Chloroflexi bacterium]|nr:MAG: hypothetical protein DRJ03_12060 [Chloroflexota bacterium]
MKRPELPYDIADLEKLFEGHVPTYQKLTGEDGLEVEHLIFRNPEQYYHWAYYVRIRGALYVTGDMYAATYQWYENVSLAWIAGCNADYFRSKAVAVPSSQGVDSQFRSWDRDVAIAQLISYLRDRDSMLNNSEIENLVKSSIGTETEWLLWLNDNNYEDGDTQLLFPDYDESDCDDMLAITTLGKHTDVLCVQHWLGLRAAMKKLQEQQDEKQNEKQNEKQEKQ